MKTRILTKTIDTLVTDIFKLLKDGKKISEEDALKFGKAVASTIQQKLKPRVQKDRGTLRMSNIGKPDRQLWYDINMPKEAEPIEPKAYLKFLYGDLIEDIVLFLAEQAGHTVEHRQKEVDVAGVKGHIDAVIDGVLSDVKSASPFSFKKFENGLKETEDAFGYRPQLQGYLEGLQDDDALADKTRAFFLPVQKVDGDIALDVHPKTNQDIKALVEHKKAVVNSPEIPDRCYEPIADGKSGNMILDKPCSFCSYKRTCYPELRVFKYWDKPKFFTKVVVEPRVPELEIKR